MHSGVQALPRPCPRRHPGRLLQDQEDQAQEQALQPGPRSLPRAPRTQPKPRRPRTVPGTPRAPRPHATGFREAPRAAGPAGVPLLGPPGRPAPSCQLSRPAERPRRSPHLRLPPGALQRRAGSSCGSQPPPLRPVVPPAETPVGAPEPPAVPREAGSTKRRPLQGVRLSQAGAGRETWAVEGAPRTHCPGAWGTRGTAAVLSFLRAPQASGSPVRRPHPCAHLSLCLLRTPGRTRLLIQFLFCKSFLIGLSPDPRDHGPRVEVFVAKPWLSVENTVL